MLTTRTLKRICSAAALAAAVAVAHTPAEAQRSNASHLVAAAGNQSKSAASKPVRHIKSVPPRKRSRCYG